MKKQEAQEENKKMKFEICKENLDLVFTILMVYFWGFRWK